MLKMLKKALAVTLTAAMLLTGMPGDAYAASGSAAAAGAGNSAVESAATAEESGGSATEGVAAEEDSVSGAAAAESGADGDQAVGGAAAAMSASDTTEDTDSTESTESTENTESTESTESTEDTGSTVTASGTCGNLQWRLESDGAFYIEGNGIMPNYSTRSLAPWYNYHEQITKVVLCEGVTSIGWYAFYECSNLLHVCIPDSVTSIGRYTFSGCSNLPDITIPDSVTATETNVFAGCTSLKNVTLSNGMTSITHSAFSGCSSLEEVIIPDSVTSIDGYAFCDCSSLLNVTIPDSVTSIGDKAFNNCSRLKKVTIPDSVTSISSNAFGSCSSLTSINIPDSVTSIGSAAFSGCSNLKKVTIPDSVTSIGDNIFGGCSSLTSMDIPNSVTSIGSYAFYECGNLKSVSIPDSVTSIGYRAFKGCGSLTTIIIPDSVTTIAEQAFWYCDGLIHVTIGNGVTTIGENAFSCCGSIVGVTMGSGVTSIGSGAFDLCYALTDVYYNGSEEQWAAIYISDFAIATGNSYLTNATIHYIDSDNRTSIEVETVHTVPLGSEEFETAVFKVKCPNADDSGTVCWSSSDSSVFELTGETSCRYSGLETEVTVYGNGLFPGTSTITIMTSEGIYKEFDVTVSGRLMIIDSWDAANRYFLQGNVIGLTHYLVTDDTTVEGSMEDFVKKYALVCLKEKDGDSTDSTSEDEVEVAAVYPVTVAYGTLTDQTDDTVTIDGTEYPYKSITKSNSSTVSPIDPDEEEEEEAQVVKYYMFRDTVIDMDYPFTSTGTFEEIDSAADTVTIDGDVYPTSDLTDKSYLNYAAQILGWKVKYQYLDGVLISITPVAASKVYLKQVESYDKTANYINFKDETGYWVKEGTSVKGIKANCWVYCTVSLTTEGILQVTKLEKLTSNPTVSIHFSSGSDIEYKNGDLRFSGEKDYKWRTDFEIPVSITVKNTVALRSATNMSSGKFASDSTLSCTVDSLSVSAPDGFNFGWLGGGEIELEEPITLKAGESETWRGYLRADALFSLDGSLMKTYAVKGSAGVDGKTVKASSSFTVTDMEQKEAQTEIKKKAKAASDELDSLNINKIIAADEGLMNTLGFDDDDETLFLKELLTKIILSNAPEETFREKISKKILQKVFKYKEDLDAQSYTCTFTCMIETEKYGTVELKLICDIGEFSYSSTTFGKLANIKYELDFIDYGGSSSPYPTSGTFGTVAYADVEAFSDAVYDVAESQIEEAYNTSWGNDADQVSQWLFGDTVTRILNANDTSYKEVFWKFATAPSKTAAASCPVDVYVYDASGALCGSIEDDEVTLTSDDFTLKVEGETKYVIGLTDEYTIRYLATGDGTMDVEVTEYLGYEQPIRTVSYTAVPLTTDEYYEQVISGEFLKPASTYDLYSEDDEETTYDVDEIFLSIQSKMDNTSQKEEQTTEETDSSSKKTGDETPAGSDGTPAEKITLSGYTKIAAGKKTKLTLTVSPENASAPEVIWKSGNTKVATVNQNGVVTFQKNSGGKSVVIYAATKDGQITASLRLKSMKGVVKKITLSGRKKVKAGKSVKLKASVKASKGANKKLAWSSSNPAYAVVNSKGKVTALKAGKGKKVKITARATDGSGKKKTITLKIR